MICKLTQWLVFVLLLAFVCGCEGNGGACHPRGEAAVRGESQARCEQPRGHNSRPVAQNIARKPLPPAPQQQACVPAAMGGARELDWGLASNASLPNCPAERPVSANCNTGSCDSGYFYVGVNVNDGWCNYGPRYGYTGYNCGPNWNGGYWHGNYQYNNWNNCNTNWNRGCPPNNWNNCPTPPRQNCPTPQNNCR